MSYGLKITNSSGGLVLDSQYENLYMQNETPNTAVPGDAIPDLGPTQLLFAKPTTANYDTHLFFNSGVFGGDGTDGDDSFWDTSATGYSYYILEPSSMSSPGTGYGLEIQGVEGSTYFSSEVFENQGYTIAAAGNMVGSDMYFPSETGTVTDLDKYYVMLNGTFHYLFGRARIDTFIMYEYQWTATNEGRIHFKISKDGFPGILNETHSMFIIKEKI